MTTCFKAFLIDPATGSLKAVAIDNANSYEELRKSIGCEYLDTVLLDAETTIYCDDDGLCDGLIASTDRRLWQCAGW